MDAEKIGSSGHRVIPPQPAQERRGPGTPDIGPSENQEQNQKQQQPQDQLRPKQRAEALLKKIGEACDELDRLAEENPELVGRVTRGAEEHKEAYLRLKARLQMADAAPRCRWVRQDGTGCGSPQMKKHIYCFAHKQMLEAQALALQLPAAEDANAIQIGIMRIQKALIEGTISTKMAGLLLYSVQLALQNVRNVTFGQVKAEELVRETVTLEQAVREDLGIGSSEKQNQNQRPSTTEDTHSTPFGRSGQAPGMEEGKTLPLMNADDADQEEKEGEFVPLPGGAGYRFTRYRSNVEPGSEREGAWKELPKSSLERDTLSGSFDPTPQREGRVGDPVFAPSLAPPLRLAQDDKITGGFAKVQATLG